MTYFSLQFRHFRRLLFFLRNLPHWICQSITRSLRRGCQFVLKYFTTSLGTSVVTCVRNAWYASCDDAYTIFAAISNTVCSVHQWCPFSNMITLFENLEVRGRGRISFFKVSPCCPQRYFMRTPPFYLNTEMVSSEVLVYFGDGNKSSFYYALRDVGKIFIYNSISLEVIAVVYYKNCDGAIHACAFTTITYICLWFHQSNCASAIKRMRLYYRHIYIFVFFHVFAFSMLLPFMLKSTALRAGAQMLCNTISLKWITKLHQFRTIHCRGSTIPIITSLAQSFITVYFIRSCKLFNDNEMKCITKYYTTAGSI